MTSSARLFALLMLAAALSAPTLSAQDGACRPVATSAERTVCLATNLEGALADGAFGLVRLGATAVAVPVDPGADSLRVFPPSDKDWSIGQIVVSLESGSVDARFPHHYRIESMPPGASVISLAGDTLGATPATLVRGQPMASVRLQLDGYAPAVLQLDTLVWNAQSTTLRPLALAGAPDLQVERWTRRSTRRGWIDAAALGLATVATAGAIYYKFEANRLYRDYERTGDPDLRPRIQRLDTRSGIALGAGQVGLGVFAFRLIRR